ncbi:MAG: ABC transporter substrate-binding protein [Chloroflexi bacterium]|nr:ABC transporter substrate-binding protein [Chloroflexota bacterium]
MSWIALVLLVLALAGCGGDGDGDNDKDDGRTYRIGVISGSDLFNSTIDAFKAQLAENGYVEGENISYDVQFAANDAEKMAQFSQKFVEDKVDLIFTTANTAAAAARTATEGTDIPVVFTFVVAPVETRVVTDLTRPGGNLTGVRNPVDVFVGKRVEILLKIAPDVKRLWVPYNPAYPTVAAVLAALRIDAPTLGVELVETTITAAEDIPPILDAYEQAGDPPFDAIIIMPDLTVQGPASWNAILAYAQKHGLMISANTQSQVEEGALFSYLSNNESTGKQAARLARQILEGIPPADLPVETGEVFLVINLKVAEDAGLGVPNDIIGPDTVVIR